MYPSLTSTLSSILRQVDRKGFKLIHRKKKHLIASGGFLASSPCCKALDKTMANWVAPVPSVLC